MQMKAIQDERNAATQEKERQMRKLQEEVLFQQKQLETVAITKDCQLRALRSKLDQMKSTHDAFEIKGQPSHPLLVFVSSSSQSLIV